MSSLVTPKSSFISYASPRSAPKKDHAPKLTTLALGEEGGGKEKPINDDPMPKCLPGRPPITTLALGEEGASSSPSVQDPSCGTPVTKAIGEDAFGKIPRQPPKMTTMAMGEEGGMGPPVTSAAMGCER
jgi:hypothetical protein